MMRDGLRPFATTLILLPEKGDSRLLRIAINCDGF
jgi:hypothetical protein